MRFNHMQDRFCVQGASMTVSDRLLQFFAELWSWQSALGAPMLRDPTCKLLGQLASWFAAGGQTQAGAALSFVMQHLDGSASTAGLPCAEACRALLNFSRHWPPTVKAADAVPVRTALLRQALIQKRA